MIKSELYENLLAQLDRSLIVDDKTRDYWLKNYKTLPVTAVQIFCDRLALENSRVDELIAAGLDANPSLAEQIVIKCSDAKRKAFKFVEQQETQEENPDEFLKQSLS